jgi:hypothetical protein
VDLASAAATAVLGAGTLHALHVLAAQLLHDHERAATVPQHAEGNAMNRAPRGERRRDRCASAGRRSRLERRWPRAAAWARPPFASWCSVHRVSFGVMGHGGRTLMIVEELGCQNAQGVQRASAKNGRRRGTLPDLSRPASAGERNCGELE